MRTDDDGAVLERAAARARGRPEYLGRAFAVYQETERMTETTLREYLGVALADWPRLALCLRPRAEGFVKDVTEIADEFRIDRGVLAAVIRRVDAVEAVRRREQPGQAGTLLAARTRKQKRRPRRSEGGRP